MVDHSASKDVIKQINDILNSHEGVKRVDNLRTRLFANRIYVEVEIAVDETLSVKEGHQIAENIHDEIENTMEEVKHVMVHVNPHYNTTNHSS